MFENKWFTCFINFVVANHNALPYNIAVICCIKSWGPNVLPIGYVSSRVDNSMLSRSSGLNLQGGLHSTKESHIGTYNTTRPHTQVHVHPTYIVRTDAQKRVLDLAVVWSNLYNWCKWEEIVTMSKATACVQVTDLIRHLVSGIVWTLIWPAAIGSSS